MPIYSDLFILIAAARPTTSAMINSRSSTSARNWFTSTLTSGQRKKEKLFVVSCLTYPFPYKQYNILFLSKKFRKFKVANKCLFVGPDKQADRQNGMQADRQTDRQAGRHIDYAARAHSTRNNGQAL